MQFLTVIITGLLALIGGFIGAYIQKKTQHQIWLSQERAEAFSGLLITLDKCIESAAQLFKKGGEKNITKLQRFNEIYAPAFIYTKIACFFLTPESKKRVEKLVRDISSLHRSRMLGEKRHGTMNTKINDLQNILEEDLLSPKWNKSNRMTNMSGKTRLSLLLTAIWFLFWCVVAEQGHSDKTIPIFVFGGVVPLIIGWGIWWVRQGFKKAARSEHCE
ncbi:MAG: hypothetical protein JRD93_17660 [Deltaproteobacteria bacterium]|nr:hypothetical protein [Deltaproteobacteria bacterium]MBW2663747.1 hypothetical protein [Deltaproteobacteria bacterium]